MISSIFLYEFYACHLRKKTCNRFALPPHSGCEKRNEEEGIIVLNNLAAVKRPLLLFSHNNTESPRCKTFMPIRPRKKILASQCRRNHKLLNSTTVVKSEREQKKMAVCLLPIAVSYPPPYFTTSGKLVVVLRQHHY